MDKNITYVRLIVEGGFSMDKSTQEKINDLNKRHTIDKLRFLKHIQENGKEDIRPLIESYVKERMEQIWEKIAEENKPNDIEKLIEILWKQMGESGGFEYTVEKNELGTQIKCTYCPLVETAIEADARDIAFHMFCMSDYPITEAFNSAIGFKRTKTLMEGDECCNHFYYNK